MENNKDEQEQIIQGARCSFSLEEFENIAHDIMNLGMDLRQKQLQGYATNSGNEILKEYLDKLKVNVEKKIK